MRTGDRFPCSLPKDEGAGSLYGVKTGVCPRIGLEGWLKWFAHHLGGIEGRVGHPTISSSAIPFSSCPQSFPASGSFPMSQLFMSGGQTVRASALASVLSMNIQG